MNILTGTGLYHFELAFFAPTSTVMGPNANNVQQIVAEYVGIPEDHTFVLGKTAVGARSERHAGNVTFVNWEGDNPSAQVAPIYVDVYRPGFLARAWATARGREANATVNVAAYGSKPLGGGDPMSAPDNLPLPVGPARNPQELINA